MRRSLAIGCALVARLCSWTGEILDGVLVSAALVARGHLHCVCVPSRSPAVRPQDGPRHRIALAL